MQTKELKNTEKLTQEIQLVKGEFTPSEASDVLLALIDEKINFHKIQRLQQWEGNHGCNSGQLDGRIQELEKEKQNVREYIAGIKSLGKNLSINGVLEITLAN